MSIKIGVIGAAGRMGKAVIRAIGDMVGGDYELVAACVRDGSPYIDIDAGNMTGGAPMGIKIMHNMRRAFEISDVIIDFSSATETKVILDIVKDTGTPLVLGTSGSGINKNMVEKSGAHHHAAIVVAANSGIGVNVIGSYLGDMHKQLGVDQFDADIIDIHHSAKKDKPSGTAKQIADILKIPYNEISSIRAGGSPGEHIIRFSGQFETIEIKHTAISRDAFGVGAVRAAAWIIKSGYKSGIYSMNDVLDLS